MNGLGQGSINLLALCCWVCDYSAAFQRFSNCFSCSFQVYFPCWLYHFRKCL